MRVCDGDLGGARAGGAVGCGVVRVAGGVSGGGAVGEMADRAKVDACLLAALHGYAASGERWQERRERGLTNAELQEALRYEFGISRGSTYPEWWHAKGSPPEFTYTRTYGTPESEHVTLRGARLLARVRDMLDIQEPGVKQMRLW